MNGASPSGGTQPAQLPTPVERDAAPGSRAFQGALDEAEATSAERLRARDDAAAATTERQRVRDDVAQRSRDDATAATERQRARDANIAADRQRARDDAATDQQRARDANMATDRQRARDDAATERQRARDANTATDRQRARDDAATDQPRAHHDATAAAANGHRGLSEVSDGELPHGAASTGRPRTRNGDVGVHGASTTKGAAARARPEASSDDDGNTHGLHERSERRTDAAHLDGFRAVVAGRGHVALAQATAHAASGAEAPVRAAVAQRARVSEPASHAASQRHAPAASAPTEPGFAAAERAAAASSANTPAAAPAPVFTAPTVTPGAPAALPRAVDASQTLLQLAMADSSLTVDVHRQVVNVALTTEATGTLELELRLHEGRAHVMVSGPSAPLMTQHGPALREVLAQQGLSLGEFGTSQEQRQPAERAEREAPTVPPTTTPAGVTAPSRSRRHEGRIDVEA